MANPFDIEGFRAEIGKGGVAKPSNFYVRINSPSGYALTRANDERILPLRIESVNMPGRSISTFQRHTYGRPREMPASYTTLPIQISVILSETMWERQYFMGWQDLLIGSLRATKNTLETPDNSDIGYYDSGVGSIEIYQMAESPNFQVKPSPAEPSTGIGNIISTVKDVAGSLGIDTSIVTKPFGFNIPGFSEIEKPREITHVTKVVLHEVYPLTVNDLAMNWGDSNSPAKLTVELRYAFFTEEHNRINAGGPEEKSAFRRAAEGFGRFIPVLSSIKNTGVRGTIKSQGRSFIGAADGITGTAKSILPIPFKF